MLSTFYTPKLWNDLFLETENVPKMNLYNKTDTNSIVMELSVPGFTKENIEIFLEKNILKISGLRTLPNEQYLHQEDFDVSFKRSLSLEKNLEIKNVLLKDGILTIELVRNIPEEEKPKKILIQ